MPHVIVRMQSGRTEEQKQKLAEAVTKAVMAITGNGEDSISVSIEDFAPSDWAEKVYKPDIESGAGKLLQTAARLQQALGHPPH
jgi:4-oxalocrotonate tautomerase